MQFGLASKIFRRGVSVSTRTSRTLPFDAKKKMGYIALVEDFTEFGLASTIFRRGVSVSARTSWTLPFDTKTKKWAISLSSRISRSLVLLPQFSEGVFPFGHGLHGHCLLTPKQKNGLYHSRRGFHGV